jgi:hypothetical protein
MHKLKRIKKEGKDKKEEHKANEIYLQKQTDEGREICMNKRKPAGQMVRFVQQESWDQFIDHIVHDV